MAASTSRPASKAKSPRAAACAHVYRKFQDLKGVKPTVRPAGPNKVFTFKARLDTGPGGPNLSQIVKVTVSPEGKILKVVASR